MAEEQITGDDSIYPTDFTIGDDSDPATAAITNVGLTALAHRTANLNKRMRRVDTMQRLTFIGRTQPAATPMNGLFYDVARRRWYLCANTNLVYTTTDRGITWGQETLTGAAGENALNGDCDSSGNVVIATDTRYVFSLAASGPTWSKIDVDGPTTSTNGSVVYDPVHSMWVRLMSGSLKNSPDRINWTENIAAWLGAQTTWTLQRLAVNKTTGRCVATALDLTGNTFRVSTSDDGYTTKTDRTNLTTAIPAPTVSWLSYDPETDTWLMIIGETSGTRSCEVWRSVDDGATFTKIATLLSSCLGKPAALGGGVWIAPVSDATLHDVAYSEDGGVTWFRCGTSLEGTPRVAAVGAGQVMVLTNSQVYRGITLDTTASIGSLT